ncbi:MAG TPA: low specificity L-threonine aldolase [Ignavibacteriales bacterium]|nr:low specificity L-threonine aldolase [Ignavibacteriales bacterium]
MKIIDLRSDTVTRPTKEMRKAMYEAEVGDDVYGEDPTANELERYAAELLGKEKALFVPSGVMGNQLCLNALTHPADEVICESDAHIFQYESGSPAMLSGIQLYPIPGKLGVLSVDEIEHIIRPESAYYMPRTKVIEVENTHNRAGGTVHPIENIKAIKKLANKYKLYTHLDGARLWNASVASGISPAEYASYFDTVSCCLSKGLGAPVGTVIAGSKELMKEAHRKRKAWGGGMRQIGFLAAAGLYALKNNIERLKEDHEKAQLIAAAIDKNPGLIINMESVQTNIVVFRPLIMTPDAAIQKCKDKGLLISAGTVGSLRIVTHLDANFDDVKSAIKILDEVFFSKD